MMVAEIFMRFANPRFPTVYRNHPAKQKRLETIPCQFQFAITVLKRLGENSRGRTLICRLGRVACPRSSVATAAVLIASDKTLRWSGGKPPFLTCELAGLEPSLLDR